MSAAATKPSIVEDLMIENVPEGQLAVLRDVAEEDGMTLEVYIRTVVLRRTPAP